MRNAICVMFMGYFCATHSGDAQTLVTSSSRMKVSGVVESATALHTTIRRALVTLSGDGLPLGTSAITREDGTFAIENVPAGIFTLLATKPGYLPARFGATEPGQAGLAIRVSNGRDVEGLAIAMWPGAAIGGTIRDQNGRPRQGVGVSVTGESTPGGSSLATVSDDQGRYRVFGLAPGEYLVSASLPRVGSDGRVIAMSTTEMDTIFKELERSRNDPTALSRLAPLPTQTMIPVTTYYPGVTEVTGAAKIRLGPGEDFSNADIVVKSERSVSVEGVVMSSRPAESVTVTLAPLATNIASYLDASWQRRTGPDGRFGFAGVGPGKYVIQAWTKNAAVTRNAVAVTAEDILLARVQIEVADQDVSGVALTLVPVFRVRGRVAFDSSEPHPPIDPTTLRVSCANELDRSTQRRTEQGLTADAALATTAAVAADGRFEIVGLPGENYGLTAAPMPPGFWLRSAMLGSTDVLDRGLQFSTVSGEMELVLTFSDRHTLLSGHVRSGNNSSAYSVIVYSRDRTMWGEASRRVRMSRALSDGTFSVKDLPPGDYLIAAAPVLGPGVQLDSTFLTSLLSSSTEITLNEGEHKTQDVRIGIQ